MILWASLAARSLPLCFFTSPSSLTHPFFAAFFRFCLSTCPSFKIMEFRSFKGMKCVGLCAVISHNEVDKQDCCVGFLWTKGERLMENHHYKIPTNELVLLLFTQVLDTFVLFTFMNQRWLDFCLLCKQQSEMRKCSLFIFVAIRC